MRRDPQGAVTRLEIGAAGIESAAENHLARVLGNIDKPARPNRIAPAWTR